MTRSDEARRILEDDKLVQALWRLTWAEAHKDDRFPEPCPRWPADVIRRELGRILGFRRQRRWRWP